MQSFSFAKGPIQPFPVTARPAGLCRAWRGLTFLLLAFGLSLVLLSPATAGDGALDPSFVTGSGSYAGVQYIPEFKGNYGYPNVTGAPYNGYQLFFGNFYGMVIGTSYYQYNSMCRWTNTGQLDTTFVNPQINGEIRSVYIYPHNDPNFADKILIGGSFNAFSGSSQYCNLARLNANGSLDTTFTPAIYWGGAVSGIGVQGSGTTAKILAGGYNLATNIDGGPRYQLIRCNYDGSLDSTYTHWGAPGGYIASIRVPDQYFPSDVRVYGSYPKNQDGSGGIYYMLLLDANAALPSITPPLASIGDELIDGPLLNLAKQSDGKWTMCGQFKNVYNTATSSWVPRNRVARLGTDARTLDTSYDVGVGANASVISIMPMNSAGPTYDDHMVLAGSFTTWNGSPCGHIVRLKTDGTLDSTFNSGTGADDLINRLSWNSNGTGGMIYGYFRSYNGQPRGGLASLNGDGSYNTSYSNVGAFAGGCGWVYSLAAQSDGKIIIGGDFNGVGGKYAASLARINSDGSLDTSFKCGIDGIVRSVAVQSDGKILIGGSFGGCNRGFSRTSLARVNPDGSLDTAFNPMLMGPQSNSLDNVYQVVPLANGQIMIAGELYNASGPTGTPATRLNSDGSFDFTFNAAAFGITGVDWYWCSRIAPVGANYVIAGGYDTSTVMGGGGFLARLTSTGALDTAFGPNTHIQTADGEINDLLLQPDGKILVSGTFSHILGEGTVARSAIARFSALGSLDATFTPSLTPPPGANTIALPAMARQPNGKILIEANFLNNLGGGNYNYVGTQVARLNSNGSLDSSFSLGNLNTTNSWYYPNSGNSILRLPTGKALIGGVYSTYNGAPVYSLARIFAGPASFNPGFLLPLTDN